MKTSSLASVLQAKMNKIHAEERLFYTGLGHNKEYYIALVENWQGIPGYSVIARWGRRGQLRNTMLKLNTMSVHEAARLMEKVVKAKRKEGYTDDPSGGQILENIEETLAEVDL